MGSAAALSATCDIIQIIGKEALIKLQSAIGPAQTYIPITADKYHPISEAIGLNLMIRLCKEIGGTTVWIGNGYANQRRNEEISRLVREGAAHQNIADQFGITVRYVRMLTKDNESARHDRETFSGRGEFEPGPGNPQSPSENAGELPSQDPPPGTGHGRR